MAYVEFTIEPFVEGDPGPHVTAAIAVAADLGLDVDVGPFGTSCTVDLDAVGALVGAVTDAALGQGATHVSVHVAREIPPPPSPYERPQRAAAGDPT